MKMKNILNEWRNFRKINESEAFSFDPETMTNADISRVSPKTANPRIVDKTNFNLKQTIKDIYKILESGGDKYVTFVDAYDESVPRLTVNPHIQYQTPHGIYSYPLNFNTFSNMLSTGSPDVEFATNRPYFHVFQADDINKIKINSDLTTNYRQHKYPTDLRTVVRMYCQFTLSHIFKSIEVYNYYAEEINDIRSTSEGSEFLRNIRKASRDNDMDEFNRLCYNYLFKDFTKLELREIGIAIKTYIGLLNYEEIVTGTDEETGDEDEYYDYINNPGKYEDYITKDSRRVPEKCVDFLSKILNAYSNTKDNKFYKRTKRSRFYNIYYIIRILSQFTENDYGEKSIDINDRIVQGGMFSIFLRGINIDAIDDLKGTSTLHHAEPSQAVAMEISKDTIDLLGTYRNPYGNASGQQLSAEQKARILDNIENCVNELAEEGIVDLTKLVIRRGSHKVNTSLTDYEVNILAQNESDIQSVIDAVTYYVKDHTDRMSELYDRIIDSAVEMGREVLNSGFSSNKINIISADIEKTFIEIFKESIELTKDENTGKYEEGFISAVVKTNQFKEAMNETKKEAIQILLEAIDENLAFAGELKTRDQGELLSRIENILNK